MEDKLDELKGLENVRVLVRCRPASKLLNGRNRVEVDDFNGRVTVSGRDFHFDAAFGPKSNTEQLYMKSVRPLVDSSFIGYNCTCFLYGQTGTGKTFTHTSLTESAFAHLFTLIQGSATDTRFLLRVSYYELYNEEIRDLLSKSSKSLDLRESPSRGVYIKDMSCHLINSLEGLRKLKAFGDKRRATAATKMNDQSSRSHSILSIAIETVEGESTRVGRLNLVDLAGSERQVKSGSKEIRLKEASKINLSLTCLALVIRSLTDPNSSHVPYRNSKLTRILSNSLGGNSKTLLIACISMEESNLDETLNTLRFASRAKRVQNKAKVNEDARNALLREYKRQVEDLRHKLSLRKQFVVADNDKKDSTTDKEAQELLQQLEFLKAKILVGGENILEKAEMHEKLLEASRLELEQERTKEHMLRQQLLDKQAQIDKMSESRDTLEGQLANLDEKLVRAMALYKETKEDAKDLEAEHEDLKENLLQGIKAISKEIKYADCIINSFITRDYLDVINSYAHYDEESDEWQIKYIALSGNNVAQTKRLNEQQSTPIMVKGNDHEARGQQDDQSPYIGLDDIASGRDII